jgi:hypothetical protein
VWDALERDWQPAQRRRVDAGPTSGALHLAQAQSNQGRHGRKRDFPDAERLVNRLVAHELTFSFVPDVTQRLWRTVTRRKYQLTRNRVQLQNRLESLLEEAHIKVSTLVSDLLGASARRMLHAVATGETDPTAVAALGSPRLRATPEQLCDALGAATHMDPLYRRLLAMTLADLDLWSRTCGNSMRNSRRCSVCIRMRCSDSRRCLASVSIRRSRSSRKWAPRRRRFRRPSAWRPGWAPVRGMTKAPASTTVTAPRAATADASLAQSSRARGGEDQGQYL